MAEYPWLGDNITKQFPDDHPSFDEWQKLMEEWESATSKELNIAYGTEQIIKCTPAMKTITVEQHMEWNSPKKRQKQGAWMDSPADGRD